MRYLNIKWVFSLFLILGLSIQSEAQVVTYLTETFEGDFPPTDWTLSNTGTGNDWIKTPTDHAIAPGDENSMVYLYHTGGGTPNAWAFTPGINLTGGRTVEVYFDSRRMESYSEILKVTVGTAPNANSQTTVLFDETLQNTSYLTTKLTYEVQETGTYYFAFNCHSEPLKYNLYVTNIIIKDAPTCPKPKELEASNIGIDTVNLSWTAGGSESQWTVEYGEQGFELGTGTTQEVNGSATTTLHNLMSNTIYDVYVKANCATDDISEYSEPINFKTACDVFTELNEDFSSFLPDCWLTKKGYLTDDTQFNEDETGWMPKSFSNDGETGAIAINAYGNNITSWLISPSIDLGNTQVKQLEFDVALTAFQGTNSAPAMNGTDDKLAVVISTDNGLTWSNTNILQLWDNQGSPAVYNYIPPTGQHITLPLNNYSGIVKLGFYVESLQTNTNNTLHIDNVSIENAPSCSAPSGFSIESINNNSVTFTWDNQTDAHWDIKYIENTAEATEPSSLNADNLETNTYTINNLQAETSYKIWIRKDCNTAENNTEVSEWGNPFYFTTLDNCPSPIDVEISVAGTQATVNWNGLFVTHWDIEYGLKNFSPTGTPMVDNHTETSLVLDTLQANTQYDIYLRADCGEDNTEVSEWVGPFSFTTDCAVLTTLNENFDVYPFVPDCWSENYGLLTEQSSLDNMNTANWMSLGFANNGTVGAASIIVSGNSLKDWLITPPIDLGNSHNKQLEFDLALTQWNNSNAPTATGESDKFAVVILAEGQAVWSSSNTLRVWDNQSSNYQFNEISSTGEHITIYLNEYSGVIKLAFYAESMQTDYSNSLFVDNVMITEVEACSAPYELINNNTTATSSDINWQTNGSETQWEVVYGLNDFNINSATPVLSNSTTLNITGLTPNTNYDVYARAVCSETENSEWSERKIFRTLNNEKDFLTFSHPNQTNNAVINTAEHSVQLEVGSTVDLATLITEFTLSEYATASIGGNEQTSGVTSNDFSSPVVYTITAEDGSTQDWTVTVTKLEDINTENDILSFSLPYQVGNTTINNDNHTVTLEVDWLSELDNLQPSFTLSYGANAYINNNIQHSGVGYVDFTQAVTYTITAEDGTSSQDWTVTVTKAGMPDGVTCAQPINLELPANNISGTTNRFGNDYSNINQTFFTNYMSGDDIVYKIVLPEDGQLSGNVSYSIGGAGGFFITDATPGVDTAYCRVLLECSDGATENSFTRPFPAGTYYVIISTYAPPQSIDFTFSINYQPELSSEAKFLSYNIPGQIGESIILSASKKVKVKVPYGSDLSSLVANFTLSEGANAKVNNTPQESGVTANNWAANEYIQYSITAEDGVSISNWKVYVETEGSPENDILSYSIPNQIGNSTINTQERRINIMMPANTNLSNLVAEFTLSQGAHAVVNGMNQESGVTPNNWLNNQNLVEYVILSSNGTPATWKVYVKKQINHEAEIIELQLLPTQQNGNMTYDSENALIEGQLRPNIDLTQIVFHKLILSEGATASVNGTEIIPDATMIDFTDTLVIVQVRAQDGVTTKDWKIRLVSPGNIDIQEMNHCMVYPNPAKDVVNIQLEEAFVKCDIYNMSGVLVKQSNNKHFSIAELKSGIYTIKITTSNHIYTQKLVVSKR